MRRKKRNGAEGEGLGRVKIVYQTNSNLVLEAKTIRIIKPRLHEQFLCGNCMWQFLFARVDGSTNI